MSTPERSAAQPPADWEAFYRDYRKPGYVQGYEITSKLGGGMFGLVYKAQKQSIGKDYAIKFLKVDDGEVRAAVLAELEQVRHFAQIDHPNLVAIEDRGEVDGIPYLVMAYAGSQTLRDLVPCDAPLRQQVVNYFLQACRGVAALHEKSLVHFDLKPANVFLKGNVARVGDYGLSKLVTHSGGSLSMGRGTPYYMAPEVLQRRGDQRSDIYSLGVMLYEILVGRVPFTGDSEWEVLKQHEQKQPEFPPGLPQRERRVLERCLQKDPAARFQRVEELIAAMGAEASAASAAFTDARGGGAPPPPPPRENKDAPPPPKGGPDDPYAAFGRAAREAATHAGRIAREAALHARDLAKKVGAETATSLRTALRQARDERRAARAQRREVRAAARAAARQARSEARALRRRRFGPSFAVVALLGFAALFLFGNTVSLSKQEAVQLARDKAVAAATSAAEFASGVRIGTAPVIEPLWVTYGDSNPDLARGELYQTIANFTASLPSSVNLRISAQKLPDPGPVSSRLDANARLQLDSVMQRVRFGIPYDMVALHRLQRDALFAATEQLDSIRTDTDDGLAEARNLQEFLEDNTEYHGLRLVDDPDLSPAQRARANQNLGRLWRIFLDKTAMTDRAWKVYLELQR